MIKEIKQDTSDVKQDTFNLHKVVILRTMSMKTLKSLKKSLIIHYVIKNHSLVSIGLGL